MKIFGDGKRDTGKMKRIKWVTDGDHGSWKYVHTSCSLLLVLMKTKFSRYICMFRYLDT
jgi:hypothetical protein